jgi:hypothetical protein
VKGTSYGYAGGLLVLAIAMLAGGVATLALRNAKALKPGPA